MAASVFQVNTCKSYVLSCSFWALVIDHSHGKDLKGTQFHAVKKKLQNTGWPGDYSIFTGISHQWAAAEICIAAHQGVEQAGKDEQWQRENGECVWSYLTLYSLQLPTLSLHSK